MPKNYCFHFIFLFVFGFHITFSKVANVINVKYVYSGNLTWPDQVSVKVCVGLMNRHTPASAYLLRSLDSTGADRIWLQNIYNISILPTLTSTESFLDDCLATYNGNYIIYDSLEQQELLPVLTTLAGVLDGVPLDVSINASTPIPSSATTLVFDATKTFKNKQHDTTSTPLEAVEYIYRHHVNQTTGLSKLNPGYETQTGSAIVHPQLTGPPTTDLIDFVVYARLFNIYLTDGCLPHSQEHDLFKQIVELNPWPAPLSVMGYDSTFVIAGGDFFEAETLCDLNVGLGQIASAGTANLAFWASERDTITQPLPFNPSSSAAAVTFNASKTYLAFVIGDGDNLDFVQTSRQQWIDRRVQHCEETKTGGCSYPLLWSISPHILNLAPAWAEWYAEQLLRTHVDRFALPPSGASYAYPSMFPPAQQQVFVTETERYAQLLSTRVVTAWEFSSQWFKALESYFPLYAVNSIVNALVAVNVPFNIPALAFGQDPFKIVNDPTVTSSNNNTRVELDSNRTNPSLDHVVVFAPHEWRGTNGSKLPWANKENLNVTEMAADLNSRPLGTVTAIYLTSDGGADLDDIIHLVDLLQEHVEVVGEEIGELALASQSRLLENVKNSSRA